MKPEKDIKISEDATILKNTEKNTIYEIDDDTGNCIILPGIEIRYFDITMDRHCFKYLPQKNTIIIVHCLEGSIEWKLQDGSYMYCQEGDMQITGKEQYPFGFSLPLNHFKGP